MTGIQIRFPNNPSPRRLRRAADAMVALLHALWKHHHPDKPLPRFEYTFEYDWEPKRIHTAYRARHVRNRRRRTR